MIQLRVAENVLVVFVLNMIHIVELLTDMQLKYDFEQCAYVKPDWCPLKPVPEKHKELSIEEYEFGKLGLAFTQWYNACLKEILGE